MTARAIAHALTAAVCALRPVSTPQHGPAIRSPMRITRLPSIASVAAMSELIASARYQTRLIDHPLSSDSLRAGMGRIGMG